jgi:hypothetical protein
MNGMQQFIGLISGGVGSKWSTASAMGSGRDTRGSSSKLLNKQIIDSWEYVNCSVTRDSVEFNGDARAVFSISDHRYIHKENIGPVT